MIMFGGGLLPDASGAAAVAVRRFRPGPVPAERETPAQRPAPPGSSPNVDRPADPPATEQLIAAGWGYASLSPTTVQADSGAGLTRGIIGLVNKGEPRKPDDWGRAARRGPGARRARSTISRRSQSVDAQRVGVEACPNLPGANSATATAATAPPESEMVAGDQTLLRITYAVHYAVGDAEEVPLRSGRPPTRRCRAAAESSARRMSGHRRSERCLSRVREAMQPKMLAILRTELEALDVRHRASGRAPRLRARAAARARRLPRRRQRAGGQGGLIRDAEKYKAKARRKARGRARAPRKRRGGQYLDRRNRSAGIVAFAAVRAAYRDHPELDAKRAHARGFGQGVEGRRARPAARARRRRAPARRCRKLRARRGARGEGSPPARAACSEGNDR